MVKAVKKVLVMTLAAALTVGGASSSFAAASPAKSDVDTVTQKEVTAEKVGNVTPTVNTNKNGTAAIESIEVSKKATTVTIPKTVTVDGVEYTVTKITAGALADAKKVTAVTIPATIKTIAKGAFTGAKKLKTVTLKSTKVTVKKGAFKGLKTKKMTVKVPKKTTKKQLKALTKKLKAAGFKGKVKKAKK